MCKNYNSCLFILMFMVVLFMVPGNTRAEDDQKAVKDAVSNFYTALNNMFKGDLELMKEVWSHGDDVTYMGPGGGIKAGWEQVLSEWESQASMKLGGNVNPQDMKITVGRDIAVISNYEIGENLNFDGKPAEVKIRATNIFRKEHGKWKMIGHHTDLIPFLDK